MNQIEQYIFEILSGPLGRIFAIFMGAIIQQMFLDNTKYEVGLTVFLKRFFPKRTKVWYYRVNTVLYAVIGTILAWILLAPVEFKACVFAGITWCTTLKSIGIQIPEKQNLRDE